MRRLILLLSLIALAPPLSAHADHFKHFEFVGTTTDGPTTSGPGVLLATIVIDLTTGEPVSIGAKYETVSGTYFAVNQTGPDFGTSGSVFFVDFDNLALGLPVASLLNYKGSAICSVANPCDGFASQVFPQGGDIASDSILNGSLVETPEPSSLLLLSTGTLAFFGVARRRLFA
jgi:PEP-CTERM motif